VDVAVSRMVENWSEVMWRTKVERIGRVERRPIEKARLCFELSQSEE
jgi:hypothetical protein